MIRPATLPLLLIATALAGCGRGGDNELMRRVAQADAAAARAEAAAIRAEQAAVKAANAGAAEEPEVVEADTPMGEGTEPEPMVDPDA